MGRKGTIITLTILSFAGNINAFGWWGILTAIALLSLPYYLIWIDSKRPYEQQWRYANRSKTDE